MTGLAQDCGLLAPNGRAARTLWIVLQLRGVPASRGSHFPPQILARILHSPEQGRLVLGGDRTVTGRVRDINDHREFDLFRAQ